jgi:hypothetical protein
VIMNDQITNDQEVQFKVRKGKPTFSLVHVGLRGQLFDLMNKKLTGEMESHIEIGPMKRARSDYVRILVSNYNQISTHDFHMSYRSKRGDDGLFTGFVYRNGPKGDVKRGRPTLKTDVEKVLDSIAPVTGMTSEQMVGRGVSLREG